MLNFQNMVWIIVKIRWSQKSCIISAASWENWIFAYAKTKAQISFAVTAKLIIAFVFSNRIVQFLLYLCPKFQDFNFLLRLYRLVCVAPGRNSRRSVFWGRGSFLSYTFQAMYHSVWLLARPITISSGASPKRVPHGGVVQQERWYGVQQAVDQGHSTQSSTTDQLQWLWCVHVAVCRKLLWGTWNFNLVGGLGLVTQSHLKLKINLQPTYVSLRDYDE